MVAGQLLNGVSTNQVNTAISNVCDGKLASSRAHRHNRRTHARLSRIPRSSFLNGLVSQLHGIAERIGPLGNFFEPAAEHVRIGGTMVLLKTLQHGFHCDLARRLPGSLTAHAVANHENSLPNVVTEVVLIVGSH